MLITPIQLVDEPLQIDEAIAPGVLDYAPDIRQLSPLPVKGPGRPHRRAPRHRAVTRSTTSASAPPTRATSRSSAPAASSLFPSPVTGDFDLIFRPAGVDADTGEHAITPDETEIGYYEESGLLLEDVVREQVLLSLPSRTLCKADCQGLCPRCGQNLNLAHCSCDQTPSDPRWNALAGLADKLEVKH